MALTCFLALGSFHLLHSQCGPNEIPVSITLQTDNAPQETSFQLRDLSTGTVVFSVSSSILGQNGTFNFSTCAPAGHCLKAELIDSGLNGGSSMQIGIPGATFSSSNPGNFSQFETILVGGTQCTDLDDVQEINNYVVRARKKLTIGEGNRFLGSVAGGTQGGALCIGDNNYFSGWLLGGKVGYGSNSSIGGFNGVSAFGKAPSARPCGSNAAPTIDEFHIIPNPFGNVSNCEMMDLIPPTNNSLYVPDGVTTVLNKHLFSSIVVANGGTLLAHPGKYYGGELIIDGGTLMRAGGGGTVICDIFFQFSSVVFTEGSFVRAVINCEEVKIGNNNDFKGVLSINGKDGGHIGDNNIFALPDCPACVEQKIKNLYKGVVPDSKEPQFDIIPHPVQEGNGFQIATEDFSYPADLMIYDLSGKLVQSTTLSNSSSTQKVELPMALPSGLYLCKLASHNGDTLTRKMTIQRE